MLSNQDALFRPSSVQEAFAAGEVVAVAELVATAALAGAAPISAVLSSDC